MTLLRSVWVLFHAQSEEAIWKVHGEPYLTSQNMSTWGKSVRPHARWDEFVKAAGTDACGMRSDILAEPGPEENIVLVVSCEEIYRLCAVEFENSAVSLFTSSPADNGCIRSNSIKPTLVTALWPIVAKMPFLGTRV
jgi:hypothetical protein